MNKAQDIERILTELTQVDRENEGEYNEQLDQLTDKIMEITRDVA